MDIANSKYGSVQRGLIAEDLLKFSWADEITLSPNGQTVAYTVKQPHSDTNGYISRVYLRSVNWSEGKCLTPEVGVASAIAWSKDGNRLAYSWRSVEADVVGSAVHIYSVVCTSIILSFIAFMTIECSRSNSPVSQPDGHSSVRTVILSTPYMFIFCILCCIIPESGFRHTWFNFWNIKPFFY